MVKKWKGMAKKDEKRTIEPSPLPWLIPTFPSFMCYSSTAVILSHLLLVLLSSLKVKGSMDLRPFFYLLATCDRRFSLGKCILGNVIQAEKEHHRMYSIISRYDNIKRNCTIIFFALYSSRELLCVVCICESLSNNHEWRKRVSSSLVTVYTQDVWWQRKNIVLFLTRSW